MKYNISLTYCKDMTGSVLRTLDLILIVLGYVLATHIAAILSTRHLFTYPAPQEWASLPLTLLPITLISWAVISGYSDTYVSHREERLPYVTRNLLRTIGIWAVASFGAVFLAKSKYSSRQFLIEVILSAGGLIVLRQIATVLVLRRLRESGYDQKTAFVIGDRASCERFVALANRSHSMGYDFIHATVAPGGEIVGEKDRREVRSMLADEIFIVGPCPRSEANEDPAIRFLKMGKSVHVVPEVLDARLFRQTLGEIGGMPVLSMSSGRLTGFESFAKRTVDLVCAFVLLMLCAPIWVFTAVLVKLTSRGPVLFRQNRLGKEGRPFRLLKFRTMRVDAEQALMRSPELYQRYILNNYKVPAGEDPRLTPIGGFLRGLSIDELPQLFNVLRGEMSLVGPRPIVPAEIEKYEEFAPLFLSVKPGMTGHWQVSGRSDIREYDKRVELDLEYVRDQSMRTDFEILLRTVPTVLRRKGAY
jgi:exopolysaccharide biosynthesis polyprenyl glycosylphosphotransferase